MPNVLQAVDGVDIAYGGTREAATEQYMDSLTSFGLVVQLHVLGFIDYDALVKPLSLYWRSMIAWQVRCMRLIHGIGAILMRANSDKAVVGDRRTRSFPCLQYRSR